MVIRLKVPIEMHYTVIPMGTSKVNSSRKVLKWRQMPPCKVVLNYWQCSNCLRLL